MSEQKKITSNISLSDARLIFRNFQGKATTYNNEGNRNFGVILPDDLAEKLKDDGWKVRYLRPREDEDEPTPWLSVKVKFDPYPPIAVLITSRGKKKLHEDTIEQLDWSRIKTCDLIIRPYNYPEVTDKNGNIIRAAGVAAYLKAIYVTIDEDEFERKYADIPDLDCDYEDYEED